MVFNQESHVCMQMLASRNSGKIYRDILVCFLYSNPPFFLNQADAILYNGNLRVFFFPITGGSIGEARDDQGYIRTLIEWSETWESVRPVNLLILYNQHFLPELAECCTTEMRWSEGDTVGMRSLWETWMRRCVPGDE